MVPNNSMTFNISISNMRPKVVSAPWIDWYATETSSDTKYNFINSILSDDKVVAVILQEVDEVRFRLTTAPHMPYSLWIAKKSSCHLEYTWVRYYPFGRERTLEEIHEWALNNTAGMLKNHGVEGEFMLRTFTLADPTGTSPSLLNINADYGKFGTAPTEPSPLTIDDVCTWTESAPTEPTVTSTSPSPSPSPLTIDDYYGKWWAERTQPVSDPKESDEIRFELQRAQATAFVALAVGSVALTLGILVFIGIQSL